MIIDKENAIRAYKVFNPDWTCRNFKYELGQTYFHKDQVVPCISGFHACRKLDSCFDYYPFTPHNKVAVVYLWGVVAEDLDKLVADAIHIAEELTWYQILDMLNDGSGNTGRVNTGNNNTGSYNEGSYNTGCYNVGTYNAGNTNKGSYNTGSCNTGGYNTGKCNIGDNNAGNDNTGSYNTGSCNAGHYNAGNHNVGVQNTGNGNKGSYNTGNCNIGVHNSGVRNTGNCNTGSYNSGSYNTGRWNSGSYNTGCFNTQAPPAMFFNKPVHDTAGDISNIDFPYFLYFDLCEWVPHAEMTALEKEDHPDYYKDNGYLKIRTYKEAFRASFEKARKRDDWSSQLEKLKALPNFDAEIFYEISGIRPEELK